MGSGNAEVDRAVEWLRGTMRLLALLPWIAAVVFLVLLLVLPDAGHRRTFVLTALLFLGSSGFTLLSDLRDLVRSDRPAQWAGEVTVSFLWGVVNAWLIATLLLVNVTFGAYWGVTALVTAGPAAGALVWARRFGLQATRTAFASLREDDLAASSLEVPFHPRRATVVLGVGPRGLAIGSALGFFRTDEGNHRDWAELRRVEPVELHEDAYSEDRGTRWKVRRGPVVRLGFADGAEWQVPVDRPEDLMRLLELRAPREP
ncbi:hypothetical protein ACFV4N_40695 [Actinosynnema sp. NPDC059797]